MPRRYVGLHGLPCPGRGCPAGVRPELRVIIGSEGFAAITRARDGAAGLSASLLDHGVGRHEDVIHIDVWLEQGGDIHGREGIGGLPVLESMGEEAIPAPSDMLLAEPPNAPLPDV